MKGQSRTESVHIRKARKNNKQDKMDALVVQLSTNDTTLGLEMGQLSESTDIKDFDVSTEYGAMEYIIKYAKDKWNCPVMFYVNPYIQPAQYNTLPTDQQAYIKSNYVDNYEKKIEALYAVQQKWDIGVIDMWNENSFRTIDLSLKNYFMSDIIHPFKSGYQFWYTPFIEEKMEGYLAAESSKVQYYNYQGEAKDFSYAHSSIVAPRYYIFAGNKTQKEADALISEMGIQDNIDAWGGSATVINPIENVYTALDNDALKNMIGAAASNVKIIGIDDGATFVNNYVSQDCYYTAGIMTYGGEMKEGLKYNVAVPAFIANGTATAVNYYKTANQDTSATSHDNVTVYANSTAPLQVTASAKETTLKQAFADAWKYVFKNNYRQGNRVTEFYNLALNGMNYAGTQLAGYNTPYDLLTIVNFDEIGVTATSHINEAVEGMPGKYSWYEYFPETTNDAEKGTIPLIVSLHGNSNDSRINGDTSGWVTLAAKENLMVISPEWQDPKANPTDTFGNGTDLQGLGDDGVAALVKQLEAKYPQIDASRVYVSGLSAGGSKTMLYGVKYSNLFAGAAAFSGVNIDGDELVKLSETAANKTPLLYLCGDHDFFGMIPVDGSSKHGLYELTNGATSMPATDPNTHIWTALQSYQKVNGLSVSETPDMEADPYFGISLENSATEKLGTRDLKVGTLSDEEGVIMKLGAIMDYPHWNYEFEAEYAWNFLKNYSRDTKTGALLRKNASYQFTLGADSVWAGEDMRFEVNGELKKMTGIKVDGQLVNKDHYLTKTGSTYITLNNDYIKTLSNGKHTLTVVYEDGEVSTGFTVNQILPVNNNATDETASNKTVASANTGDATNALLYASMFMMALAVGTGFLVLRRRYH